MVICKQVSRCWLFSWGSLSRCDGANYGYRYPKLKVYPTVILQLTTLSLLVSFASGAMTVLPAISSLVLEPQTDKIMTVEIAPLEIKSGDYQPITDPKNVEKFINDYFQDIPIMVAIAKCESRFRHFNSEGNVLKGKENRYDRGVMQINLLYHAEKADELGLDLTNLDDNVAFARYLYEKFGAKPWMSSSACWAKFSQSEIAKR